MKLISLVAASVVAVGLSACGGSPCTRFETANNRVFASGTTCASGTGTGSVSVTKASFTVSTCEAAFPKCSDAEKKSLDTYIGCIEKVTPCTSGNEKAAAEGLLGCVAGYLATPPSAECSNAFK